MSFSTLNQAHYIQRIHIDTYIYKHIGRNINSQPYIYIYIDIWGSIYIYTLWLGQHIFESGKGCTAWNSPNMLNF